VTLTVKVDHLPSAYTTASRDIGQVHAHGIQMFPYQTATVISPYNPNYLKAIPTYITMWKLCMNLLHGIKAGYPSVTNCADNTYATGEVSIEQLDKADSDSQFAKTETEGKNLTKLHCTQKNL